MGAALVNLGDVAFALLFDLIIYILLWHVMCKVDGVG